MILKLALLTLVLALADSAPAGKCNGVVECLFNRLQKEADSPEPTVVTKLPPCKRMLSRHGKRSVEEVECEEETSSAPPQAEKRIFIESTPKEIRGMPGDERAGALGSELDVLRAKLRELEDGENSETTTIPQTPMKEQTTTEDVHKVLQDIENDIEEIIPLLPGNERPSNFQRLRQLSMKLAAEDKKRSENSPTTTETPNAKQNDVPSIPKSENTNIDLEELKRLVQNLIEVDKIAYIDLQKQIDDLKQGKE